MAISSLSFDALFVLFCYSPVRYLGIEISTHATAQAFIVAGLLSISISLIVYPVIQRRFGCMSIYHSTTPFWLAAYILPPIMNALARNPRGGWVDDNGDMKKMWALMVPLMFVYTIGDLSWVPLSIITNNMMPNKRTLGALNGLTSTSASLGRAVGPALGG